MPNFHHQRRRRNHGGRRAVFINLSLDVHWWSLPHSNLVQLTKLLEDVLRQPNSTVPTEILHFGLPDDLRLLLLNSRRDKLCRRRG
jgi:hypothetical protein